MEDQITVNGRVFSIRRLLGKGKGGYSYLAADEHGEYVVKQIHHEPCDYYTFGDSIISLETSLPQSSMTMRVFWPLESPCRACWMLT